MVFSSAIDRATRSFTFIRWPAPGWASYLPAYGTSTPLEVVYPGLSGFIADARKKGYSDEEIKSYLREDIRGAFKKGYTLDEVNKILGTTLSQTALPAAPSSSYTPEEINEWLDAPQPSLIRPLADYVSATLMAVCGIAATIQFFRLRKSAVPLFSIQLALNLSFTLIYALTTNWAAATAAGLVIVATGWAILGLVLMYAYSLKEKGILS